MNNPIELKDVFFSYPDGTRAIHGLSLQIKSGEKISVLGANGSGKSTLFLILNGIHKITSGNFLFHNTPLKYNSSELLKLRQEVGIVFQDPDTQIFSAIVLDEIAFGLLNLGLDKTSILEKIDIVSKEFHIDHLLNKPTHLLSYGEKKRVCLAAILVMDPGVLILDEPTSGLDPAESASLINLIDRVKQPEKSIIISTHNVDLAYGWSDRVIVMKEGKILASGSPLEIFRNRDLLHESRLEMPFIETIIQKLGMQNGFDNKSPVKLDELILKIKKGLPT